MSSFQSPNWSAFCHSQSHQFILKPEEKCSHNINHTMNPWPRMQFKLCVKFFKFCIYLFSLSCQTHCFTIFSSKVLSSLKMPSYFLPQAFSVWTQTYSVTIPMVPLFALCRISSYCRYCYHLPSLFMFVSIIEFSQLVIILIYKSVLSTTV